MSQASSKKVFLFNTSLAAIGHIAGMLATIVAGILTARYLGATGKGQVALAMGTGIFLARILCIGLDQATPYFLASKKIIPADILGSWLIVFVLAMMLVYGVFYPLANRFMMKNVFSGVPFTLLLLGSISCPLYLLRLMVNSILAGFEEFKKHTLHNIIIAATSIIASVMALVVLEYKGYGYLAAHACLSIISLPFIFCLLRKVISLTPVFSLKKLLMMLRFGAKSMLSEMLGLIDLRLDMYIVNYFMETAAVGVYSVAGAVANMFWILPNSIVTTLFPRTAASDPEHSRDMTSLLCRNALWLTIFIGGSFLLISRPLIVFVFGADFAPAAAAIALLMPGVAGQVVYRLCFADCSARGFPEKATISAAITASMTIVLDLLLIPRLGINGAALASSIAYCTGGALGLFWHCRITSNNVLNLLLIKSTDFRYYGRIFTQISAGMNRIMRQ